MRMLQSISKTRISMILAGILSAGLWSTAIWAQTSHQAKSHQPRAHRPVHITMDELHRHGGVPHGWRFTLPKGDPTAGRQVFIDMKCYTCHSVQGETFPAHKRDIGDVGPDLGGMGALHPAAYFAETIINPNAVIIVGKGHTGPDGLSRMPEFNDTLTIRGLIDLVAYLQSLTGPMAPHHHHGTPGHMHPPSASEKHPGGHSPHQQKHKK